jgi:hypothetical protein
MQFLHCARDVVVRDLARRPATGNGLRGRRRSYELILENKEMFHEALGQTIGLEVVKYAVGSSVRIRKTSVKTLWRSRPPPKRKNTLLAACVPALYDHRPLPEVFSSKRKKW